MRPTTGWGTEAQIALEDTMPTAIETLPRAQQWLAQFAQPDQDAAKLLLQHLSLVSHDGFEQPLQEIIVQICDGLSGYKALYAMREVDDGDPYFADRRSKPTIAQGAVGSEGRIAHLIDKLAAGRSDVLSHPAIQTLRKKRVQHLLLIEDAVISGTRARGFLNAIRYSSTIRSWASSGFVSFHVVAYAIAQAAEQVAGAALRPWTRVAERAASTSSLAAACGPVVQHGTNRRISRSLSCVRVIQQSFLAAKRPTAMDIARPSVR